MVITKSDAKLRGLNKYFTGKPCKRGHTAERYTKNSDCVECSKDRSMGVHKGIPISDIYEKAKQRRINKIDQYRESERAYRKKNADKLREAAKRYYWENRDKCIAKNRRWRQDNRDRLRETWKKTSRKRRSNPEGKLVCALRARMSAMVSGSFRSKTAEQYLGCSMEYFKKHLELMFSDGMNWDNYGINGWQVDHIKPISSFDLSDEGELSSAFHYSNTQPMWAKENQKKAAKWPA